MRERAAERAAVAHLRVADRARDRPEQRRLRGHHVGRREVVVAGARADGQLVAVDARVAQLVQPPDVDQQLGRGEPQLHHRQQRVAAREHLGVVAVLGQERQRGVERVGPFVGEADGDHSPPPAESPDEKPAAASTPPASVTRWIAAPCTSSGSCPDAAITARTMLW